MKSTRHKLLQLSVVLSAIFLSALQGIKRWSMTQSRTGYYTMTTQDSARNERSTPRSFVLPATAGVVFEQERQRRGETADVARCAAALDSAGYWIGNNESTSIELTEAIYRFQNDHRIPTTGRLDEPTKRLLKCH